MVVPTRELGLPPGQGSHVDMSPGPRAIARRPTSQEAHRGCSTCQNAAVGGTSFCNYTTPITNSHRSRPEELRSAALVVGSGPPIGPCCYQFHINGPCSATFCKRTLELHHGCRFYGQSSSCRANNSLTMPRLDSRMDEIALRSLTQDAACREATQTWRTIYEAGRLRHISTSASGLRTVRGKQRIWTQPLGC